LLSVWQPVWGPRAAPKLWGIELQPRHFAAEETQLPGLGTGRSPANRQLWKLDLIAPLRQPPDYLRATWQLERFQPLGPLALPCLRLGVGLWRRADAMGFPLAVAAGALTAIELVCLALSALGVGAVCESGVFAWVWPRYC